MAGDAQPLSPGGTAAVQAFRLDVTPLALLNSPLQGVSLRVKLHREDCMLLSDFTDAVDAPGAITFARRPLSCLVRLRRAPGGAHFQEQAFTVEVQAASGGGPDDAAVTVCHGTLDVAALAGARDAGTPVTVTVELPHKAGATAQPVDGESPMPAVTLDVRCIRVKYVDAGEGVADDDGAAVQAPAASGDTHPGAVTPPAPEALSSKAGTGIHEGSKEQDVSLFGDAAGAEDGASQPAPASAQRLLTDSVAALSQRVHALERELMDAHSTARQHAASLQAVQAQLVSSQEATHKAAEVKAALQEYTALLEAELETVKAERVASAAAVAEGDDGGATAALDTARAQLAEALREADAAREALAAMKNQSREEAAASVAATEERLETEAAPALDAAPAKDSAVGGEEEAADLKAQLEATRRVLAATSAELAVARSETAAVRAHSSASAAEAAEGHASRLASLATALASKSARITELESHCEALQAQRTELAGLAQEATATAAAAMAAASSHAAVHADGVAALAAAKSSGKETPAAMSGGSGLAPAAYEMRIGALQAALDAAMQDNSVAEATVISTNKKLSDALARVAAADAALAANEDELRRIRSDAARVEAASAIRDAVDQAMAQAEEDGEDDEEEDEEEEDERAALETLLEQAKAEAEAARTDARSLAVKLAAARRQLSLSSCAAADVEDASSSQAVAGAVGSPGGSVSESPGQAQNAGTPDAGVSRLRDELANAHEELARVTDAAEAEGATLKAQLAELQDALTAARDENQTLRDSLAQSHGTVTSASETRKELTRAHARIALLEADKDSLQSKLIEAQADIRAANVAASSAHARASAAVAAVAAVRGAADDADDDDEGDSVPVAKYRRLEAALDTANRQLRELSERRDRQQAAMAVEFSAQYELRQKAEAALLQQLAAKDATMAQLEAEVAQMRQSALDIGSQMQELREDMRAGGDGAVKRIAERAEAALASTRDELAAMTASRDELERVLCAHLEELVAAKVESAEVQAKIIELKAELSAGRAKIERLAQKVTALEVKRYMSAEDAAQALSPPAETGCSSSSTQSSWTHMSTHEAASTPHSPLARVSQRIVRSTSDVTNRFTHSARFTKLVNGVFDDVDVDGSGARSSIAYVFASLLNPARPGTVDAAELFVAILLVSHQLNKLPLGRKIEPPSKAEVQALLHTETQGDSVSRDQFLRICQRQFVSIGQGVLTNVFLFLLFVPVMGALLKSLTQRWLAESGSSASSTVAKVPDSMFAMVVSVLVTQARAGHLALPKSHAVNAMLLAVLAPVAIALAHRYGTPWVKEALGTKVQPLAGAARARLARAGEAVDAATGLTRKKL